MTRSDDQAHREAAARADYRSDLSELVDDLEEHAAEEARSLEVPGNPADRADTIPVDTGDEAPD